MIINAIRKWGRSKQRGSDPRMSVLIVEPEETIATAIGEILNFENIGFKICTSAEEALRIFDAKEFELILSAQTRFQFANRIIRELADSPIPVVVMSDLGFEDGLRSCDKILRKPFGVENLITCLKSNSGSKTSHNLPSNFGQR